MIHRIVHFLILLSMITFANEPKTIMLWKVEHHNLAKSSYLFGTFHTADKKINELPGKVMSLLISTETLYTETNITQKSYETIQTFMKSPELLPLKSRLSPSIYKDLKQHLTQLNTPFSEHGLSLFKTWAIALILTKHAESATNPHALFMDERLVKYAIEHSVPSLGLETPIEQLIYFDRLTFQEQELLLFDAMRQIDDDQYMQALKAWYIKGNLSGFKELQHQFQDKDPNIRRLDEKLFASLLNERNSRFAQRIDLVLQTNPKKNHFFAIGVGHLAEENGLITLLEAKGYRLSKVD